MSVPTQAENPTGYHARYNITKADGSPCDPEAVYFVLRIDAGGKDHHHVNACRSALRAYIDQLWDGPLDDLACDLDRLLDEQEPLTVEPNPFPIPNAWPIGLKTMEPYEVLCDDTGRNGGSWLRVIVDNQGDCYPSMQQWEDFPEGHPSTCPSIRIRTLGGGGRNMRTRLALLYLAQAMRLDALDNQPTTEGK